MLRIHQWLTVQDEAVIRDLARRKQLNVTWVRHIAQYGKVTGTTADGRNYILRDIVSYDGEQCRVTNANNEHVCSTHVGYEVCDASAFAYNPVPLDQIDRQNIEAFLLLIALYPVTLDKIKEISSAS